MASIANYNFKGKRALIRVDFNVPIDKNSGKVKDNTRIQSALKTIKHVLGCGGSVVLISHLGRPKSGFDKKYSLRPVADEIESLLNSKVKFIDDCISDEAFEQTNQLAPGQVVLLENLRFYPQEKAGDQNFAQKLSQHADVYINDAFGTAHRAHASTAVIAQFFEPEDRMQGFLMLSETSSVEHFLKSDHRPLVAIVGGAKVSSKINVLENLIDNIDTLLICGGMAYTFLKAQGKQTGSSLVEVEYLNTAKEILNKAEKLKVNVFLPIDSVVAEKIDQGVETKVVSSNAIPEGFMGLDIGPEAARIYAKEIEKGKSVLWNGPAGVFEIDAFSKGTKELAKSVVKATQKGAFTIIGGGDSVAAINHYNMADQVSHVSSGGGAMLEYLEGKTLPGIKALED